MADQRLTDKTSATVVNDNYLIHVVNPSDTTQDPAGSSFKALASLVRAEQQIKGIALYNATTTGAVNIPCSTFVSWRRILTGNTTLTFTETPSSGNSFTRYMDISSTTAETLDFANATHIIGTYANDTSRNKITIELSNFPTEGLVITVFINPVV